MQSDATSSRSEYLAEKRERRACRGGVDLARAFHQATLVGRPELVEDDLADLARVADANDMDLVSTS